MNAKPCVTILVSRRFSAPAERVFNAWLDPQMIHQWMFGPALCEKEATRIQVDARAGGSFSFNVRREGKKIDRVGTYLKIERPRQLVFTWGPQQESADESRVAIKIHPFQTGCELDLTHQIYAKWADSAACADVGWTEMLHALAETLGEKTHQK